MSIVISHQNHGAEHLHCRYCTHCVTAPLLLYFYILQCRVQHTWVKAAFHVFPYPVLYWPHKLAGAHLYVNLSRRNKAHLRPVNINMHREDWLTQLQSSRWRIYRNEWSAGIRLRSTAAQETEAHLPLNQILNFLHVKSKRVLRSVLINDLPERQQVKFNQTKTTVY